MLQNSNGASCFQASASDMENVNKELELEWSLSVDVWGGA